MTDRPGGTPEADELAALAEEFGIRPDWHNPDAEDDLLADPDLAVLLSSGLTMEQRQARFERRIAGLYRRAEELPRLVEQITAEAEDRHLRLRVNGSGVLTEVSFRPPARRASAAELEESFAECYARASQEATAALTAELDGFRAEADPEAGAANGSEAGVDGVEAPVGTDGDALERLFDRTLARADATLERLHGRPDGVPRR